jgi:membrane protease subunit HflK
MAPQKVQFASTEFVVSPFIYWSIIFVALLLAVGVAVLLAFYTVQDGEVAVVMRLGKFYKVSEPGLHWRLPWGIDRLERLKTASTQQIEMGFRTVAGDSLPQRQANLAESRLITGDLYLTDVFWTLAYRISDPYKYISNSPAPVAILRTLGEAAMRKAVGNYSLMEVFQTRRSEVADYALQAIQADLQRIDLGIEVISIELKEIVPVMKAAVITQPTRKPMTAKAAVDTTAPVIADSVQGAW